MSDVGAWSKGLRDYARFLQQNVGIWHRRLTEAAMQSIVNGSEVTGAPGQPVKTGVLKASWRMEMKPDGTSRVYIPADSPAAIYGPFIEDGAHPVWGALTLRSRVGGFHSVKLTEAGLPALAYYEALKLGLG